MTHQKDYYLSFNKFYVEFKHKPISTYSNHVFYAMDDETKRFRPNNYVGSIVRWYIMSYITDGILLDIINDRTTALMNIKSDNCLYKFVSNEILRGNEAFIVTSY